MADLPVDYLQLTCPKCGQHAFSTSTKGHTNTGTGVTTHYPGHLNSCKCGHQWAVLGGNVVPALPVHVPAHHNVPLTQTDIVRLGCVLWQETADAGVAVLAADLPKGYRWAWQDTGKPLGDSDLHPLWAGVKTKALWCRMAAVVAFALGYTVDFDLALLGDLDK